jgi:DnaJ-class molecular chaperone
MAKSQTLFQVLGFFDENVSQKEIKSAWRNLIKKYHPDINSHRLEWATKEAQKINEAYEILSNPEKRINYENQLRDKKLKEEQQRAFEELQRQQIIKREKRDKFIDKGITVVGVGLATFVLATLVKNIFSSNKEKQA